MKKLIPVLRFVGFEIAFIIAALIAAGLSGMGKIHGSTQQPEVSTDLFFLLVLCSFGALGAYLAAQSIWRGWKLVLTLFVAFFGINGFLTQIESLVFLDQLTKNMPEGMLPLIVANSAMVGLALALLAPLFYGKLIPGSEPARQSTELKYSTWVWIRKLSLIGVVYIVIYFAFGALVAMPLAGDVFNQFYAGLTLPWWFLPFQFGRGIVWALIAVPVLRMMRGSFTKKAAVLAFVYAVFFAISLLIPNSIFPDRLRYAHLVECVTSSLLLGWVIARLLYGSSKVRVIG